MKLVVFGATGGVGREVVRQALEVGHTVTAVVRDPAKLSAQAEVVHSDLSAPDLDVLAGTIRTADAVISAVGPTGRTDAGIAARATATIADAMEIQGVRRLVVISASPVAPVPTPHRPDPPQHDPGDDFLMRHLLAPLIRRIFHAVYQDLAAMEDDLRCRYLDWTAVRPPRLTNGPLPYGA
jgi:nucleoside-diphosphate-sugar epimerase